MSATTTAEPGPPEAGGLPAGRPLLGLLKSFVVYGAGDFLVKASGLLTMPWYAQAFGPEGYGLWGLAATTAAIAQVLLGLGLEGAYARYVFQTPPEALPALVRKSLELALLPSCLVVLLLLVLLPWAGPRWGLGPELWPLWGVALAGVPFAIANGVLGGVLRHQFRSGAFAWFSAVQGLLIVALSLGLALGTQGGVAGAVAGLSLAHAVVFPLRAWHLRHWLRRSEALQAPGPLLAYGWPLVLASMAQWVFSASDRFVLTGLVSVAESGRYGVAVSLASVLGFLATAIGQAWGPMAIQSHERHPQWTPVFFGEVLAYLLVIFGWLSVVMAWWAPELVQALAGANFGDAALALGPLALGATALVTTQVTALGISLSKQTTWFARYAWQSAALNLVLNLALVPQGGMVASAWATMISSSYLTLAYAWRSQRLVPFRVLWGTLAGAVGLSLVGVVVVAPWWRAGPLEPWFWVAKGFASLGWGGLMAASLGLTWWQKRWAWASARWRP